MRIKLRSTMQLPSDSDPADTRGRRLLALLSRIPSPPDSILTVPLGSSTRSTPNGLNLRGLIRRHAWNASKSRWGPKLVLIAIAYPLLELGRRARAAFPEASWIGWDIVIGPDGPKIMEANATRGNDRVQVPLCAPIPADLLLGGAEPGSPAESDAPKASPQPRPATPA